MPPRWENMDDGSQCFFYQSSILYGVEPNDIGIVIDNDKNVDGDDTDMHSQPNYPDFSSYFMTNEVWKPCVLLLDNCINCFAFLKSAMIC